MMTLSFIGVCMEKNNWNVLTFDLIKIYTQLFKILPLCTLNQSHQTIFYHCIFLSLFKSNPIFFIFTVWLLQTSNKMWVQFCEPYLLDNSRGYVCRHRLSTVEQWPKHFVLQLWLLQSRFARKPQDRLVKSGYISSCGVYWFNNRLYIWLLRFPKR